MTSEPIRHKAIAEYETLNQRVSAHQVRIAARNCGTIDPSNIDHYIDRGGYRGLTKALTMSPEDVIREVGKSRLRGRGGGGSATADKWRSCRDAQGPEKYMICNAAEGDPDAHSVRMLLQSDPHAVLEGMVIGAYAVGAAKGYIYVNADHVAAIERLKEALKQAENHKFVGSGVLGSGFGFHLEVFEGPGDFVCCVETAMIRAMEGERAISSIRPPYPGESGLGGKPTCINSAETLANVSAILEKGAKWFAGFGAEKSKGSKLVTLTGKVAHPGVIEVAMGTTLRQIVHEIGGGITGSRELKAVLIGGPSGGFLPASALDLPFDYEHLAEEGAVMGSGRVTVVDTNACIVDLAKNSLSFMKDESCGQCVMCREGTAQLYLILKDITEGKSKSEDIDLLLELGEGIQAGAICDLGRTAPNPVLSMIRHFREELEAHIKRKRCPALVCRKYVTYHILGEKCRGCRMCLEKCPSGAISGGEEMIHVIDQDECTRCGVCMEVCPSEYAAVIKAGGVKPRTPAEPIPVGTWRKR